MSVRIKTHVSKLRVPLGTTSDLTIQGADPDDNLTGVNWYGNDEVGFVSNTNATFTLKNNGALKGVSAIGATNDLAHINLDRTSPVTTAGKYTSLDFTSAGEVNKVLSLRAVVESSGNHAFKVYTAASNAFNSIPVFSALSSNKAGINISSPQFKLHVSNEGTQVTSPFQDTSIAVLSSESSDSPAWTINSFNDQNTTRAVLKGVKAKGTTSSPTAVTDTNYTLSLLGAGYDGTSSLITAAIDFQVSGTPSTGVMPQAIIFRNSATNTLTERMRITPAGKVGIGTNNPGPTLGVFGSVGVGSSYSTATVSSGNLVVQTSIGVGITSPSYLVHSYSANANVTAYMAETTTTGTGGVWYGMKDGLSSLPHRMGISQGLYTFQVNATSRVDLQSDGFRYKGDYSATWTDRSLVDKAYVDGLVSGGGGDVITSINGLTASTQFLVTGTSGTDFNISSSTDTHTFNLPDASASNRGVITTGTQTIAGNKTLSGTTTLSALTASLPLKLNSSKEIISALINLATDVTGVLPPAYGGTGGNGFVDLVTAQSVAGAKKFTTSLSYGSTDLPSASKFGTGNQTVVYFAGGSATLTESDFNNSQGLLIANEVNSGTQVQTAKIVAAGSDTASSGSNIEFYTRATGSGKNWAKPLYLLESGKVIMGNPLATTGDSTLIIGPYATNTSGNVGILFSSAGVQWKMEATNGSEAFRVVENSTTRAHIQIGTNDWFSGSDERLKKDINTLTVVPYLSELRGVSYRMIDSNKPSIGVIAQEIEKYFPEAVSEYTEDSGEVYKSVNYGAIASIALQACKELKQYINILEKRITALEKQIQN